MSGKLIYSALETWKEKELGSRQEKQEGVARHGETSPLLPSNRPARRTTPRRGKAEIPQELRIESEGNSFKRTGVLTNGGRHQASLLARRYGTGLYGKSR